MTYGDNSSFTLYFVYGKILKNGVFNLKKKSAILFYVLSVLFLIITIFVTVYGWINLASSAEQAGVSLVEQWVVVVQTLLATSGGFLAFTFIFLGIGLILSKLDK